MELGFLIFHLGSCGRKLDNILETSSLLSLKRLQIEKSRSGPFQRSDLKIFTFVLNRSEFKQFRFAKHILLDVLRGRDKKYKNAEDLSFKTLENKECQGSVTVV